MSAETKKCQHCGGQFAIEPEDFAFYEKIRVPSPTFCPDCRLQRRLVWRNERTLYKRPCGLCQRDIISTYDPKGPYKVYCQSCWWSDGWDAGEFGKAYDFSRPFFEQLKDLLLEVPRIALVAVQNVDSDYSNFSKGNKNCYLCFGSHYCEDCAYLTFCHHNRNCFDGLQLSNSEHSGYCNYVENVFESAFLQYSFDCMSCILCYDLRNCEYCFGCVNLRNKKYHIFNQPYSKEDYEKEIAGYLGSYREWALARQKFEALKLANIRVFAFMRKTVNSTGNDLEETKNVKNSFCVWEAEDCKYLRVNVTSNTTSMDLNNIGYDPSELLYESQGITGSRDMRFSDASWTNSSVDLCSICFSSNNLFGCVGLRSQEYCILNKKYSKEEYEALVPKIIAHMREMPYTDKKGQVYAYGEFFPSDLSPFAYNETTAQEHFPLVKDQALEQGFAWKDPDAKNYQISLPAGALSETAAAGPDILKEVIGCEHAGQCKHQCTFAFRVIPDELNWYKRIGVPLPRLCPNCRHHERIAARNPQKLWQRQCACAGEKSENGAYANSGSHFHGGDHCTNGFQTSYAPERPEIVYCEQCYQAEIV